MKTGLFSFFTTDYRDGFAYIDGKRYSAGSFAVQLLNQYYVNDTAARIVAFRNSNMEVQGQLPHGFVREMAFLKAGEECLQILKTLGKIRPFNLFDIPKEEERIRSLFRPEVYSQMDQFFHLRSKIEARDPIENYMNIYAPGYQPEEYRASLQRVTDVQDTLNFYLNVGDGINRAFRDG